MYRWSAGAGGARGRSNETTLYKRRAPRPLAPDATFADKSNIKHFIPCKR